MIVPTQTTIKALTRIRRERLLPQAGEVIVSLGQQVAPVQVVARATRQRGFAIIPAAEILGVAAGDVSKYLLVEEGAAVQKKKPLLRKRGLFGGKSLTSPVNGVLYQVSNGRLILQPTPELIELRAMVHGFVAGFLGNRGVLIETNGTLIQAMYGSEREGYGKIKVVTESNDVPLHLEHIGADVHGSVLVAGYVDQIPVLEKAEDNSVRGIVVGSVPARLVPALDIFRFPILVTDGFGGQQMAPPVFQMLQQSEGREASLFGRDSAVQGGRPEIIIPLPATEEVQSPPGPTQQLAIGQRVRILREPYAGETGEVVGVNPHARSTEIGLRMAGASVALADGRIVFVPYLNLDLIR